MATAPADQEKSGAEQGAALEGGSYELIRARLIEQAKALGLGDLDGPIIAGHEPCGVVAAIGPGVPENQAKVGQRVMVHHYRGCGVCEHECPVPGKRAIRVTADNETRSRDHALLLRRT